eukprot:GSChrysophyteH1.ASY1.ANO1.1233.1 assembled CDS
MAHYISYSLFDGPYYRITVVILELIRDSNPDLRRGFLPYQVWTVGYWPTGSIPEREPEKWLPHPRKAAGAEVSGNWNENNLNPLSRINWRASLVPAAAVIPAPIAYTKVVAVKKLVVEFLVVKRGPFREEFSVHYFNRSCTQPPSFTVSKIECSKQAYALGVFVFNCQRTKVRGSKMIRYHRSLNHKLCRLGIGAPYEKSKSLGSGGSMVARLKLKEIDGRAPPGVEPAA